MGIAATSPRQILLATDLSQRAGLAVTRAAQLSREHGAQLSALLVLPDEVNGEIVDGARSSLEAHLAEYLDRTPAEMVIRRGTAAREIAATAADRAADLVVVGAHGADWMADAFLGSTTENLVRISPVAVLLVKKPAKVAYRKVVIAVDTSPASADAVRFASGLTPVADHIVFHACVVVGETLLRMHGVGDEEIDGLRRTSTEEIRAQVMRLADTLPAPVREVVITSGHPSTSLVRFCSSRAADLVVVGTGMRSPESYALLGSVAQQVMRQSLSDVVVVPAVGN